MPIDDTGFDDADFHRIVQTAYNATIAELKEIDPQSVSVPTVCDTVMLAVLELARAGQRDVERLQVYAFSQAYDVIIAQRVGGVGS